MSLLLRHRPEEIDLRLDPEGWARLDELIRKAREATDASFDRERVRRLVDEQDKPRFSLSPDRERIRANYGHSVPVDLGLEPTIPPRYLFHGTAARTLDAILLEGLGPGSRRYVHLSSEPDAAREVGRRHGSPRLVRIQARRMHRADHTFYQAAGGIWLTKQVPPEFLETGDA